MDRLKALSVFQAVARAGSFSRAADALDISRAATSRTVQDLEAALSVRLFHRTTRRVALTTAGEAVLEQARDVLDRYEAISNFSRQGGVAARRKLRLQAPAWMGGHVARTVLADFMTQHPEIALDLQLGGEPAGDGPPADLKICLPHELRPHMVARRIGELAVGCYASPVYLAQRGEPQSPACLARHGMLTQPDVAPAARLTFEQAATGEAHDVQLAPLVWADQFDALAALCMRGMGVALLPTLLADEAVTRADLQRVLAEWTSPSIAVHIAYESRLHQPESVRWLIDHLERGFAATEDGRRPPARTTAAPALPPLPLAA